MFKGKMLLESFIFLFTIVFRQVYAATLTRGGYAPQFSPIFPNLKIPTDVVTSYNAGPYDTTSKLSYQRLEGFPETWKAPPTDLAEVKAAYNSIDWTKVPNAPIRRQNPDGSWVSTSDGANDPYCWWSSSNCLTPRVSYLPPDLYTCPNKGDWGLNHDDGPFNRYTDSNADKENPYAEPALYNFLVTHNAHTSLFYIGSNVVNYPAAAKRGLNDGHHICVHTWSHPPLTTQTNSQIVAELYWTLKAIKAATGVTSRCFRPPQGDIDDRVRAIAWQMGLRNILWDEDTNDWAMPAPGGGTLSPKVVDKFFQEKIDKYKSGDDVAGHVVLQHELNSATVNMSMFWLPKIQNVFNVIPALACNGVTQPYWEENFIYPTINPEYPPETFTITSSATTTTSISTTSTPSSTINRTPATTTSPTTTTRPSTTTTTTTTRFTATTTITTTKGTTKKGNSISPTTTYSRTSTVKNIPTTIDQSTPTKKTTKKPTQTPFNVFQDLSSKLLLKRPVRRMTELR